MVTEKITFWSLPKRGLLCIFSEFFFGVCVGAWSIALSFHLSACGVRESQIGLLLCLGYLVTAFTSFFVGRVGDRRGYPMVMALGTALMGLALLLIACVDWIPLFYVGHGLYCMGLACVMSMEFNLPLSLVRENQRQYAYNLVLVFYFLGNVVGSFMCRFCLPFWKNSANPYRYILLLCAGVYFFLTIFRGSMPRQSTTEIEDSAASSGVWQLIRSRQVQSYLLYGCLTFGLLTFATGFLNLVLRLWHAMPDDVISTVFAVNSMVGCLVLFFLPQLVRRVPLRSIAAVAMLMQLCAMVTMSFAPSAIFVVMIFVRTATCNVLYTCVDSPMLQSIPEQKRGSYAGMRVFANYIGMSIASIASGWVVDLREFRLLYLICAGIAVAQILVYQLLCRPFLRNRK